VCPCLWLTPSVVTTLHHPSIHPSNKSTATYRSIKDSTESVLIEFDPSVVSFDRILEEWSAIARPFFPQTSTTQYRSAVFYRTEEQKESALRKLNELRGTKEGRNGDVYADIEPVSAFYRAEEYHQDFLNKQMTGAGRWVR